MMSKGDGGLAFPLPIALNDVGNIVTSDEYARGGMSLRDYFAAKAMQGMLAEDAGNYTFENCAKASYEMADAMLKERTK